MARNTFYISFVLAVAYTLSPIPCFAGGISLTPSFQEVMVASPSTRLQVTFSNQSSESAKLEFSLAKTMATDVMGRFQFNAPLPQTIYPNNEVAKIEPENVLLDPGGVATISATFDPNKLKPGTNAFLLLANIDTKPLPTQAGSTLNPNASVVQYLAATLLLTARDGATVNLSLTNFDWSSFPIRLSLPDYFILTVKNDGNMHTTPRGLIRLTDSFDHEISRGPINDKSAIVLPGSQRVIYGSTTKTRNPFFVSFIKLQLNAYDPAHQSNLSLTKIFLYVNPWTGLLIPLFGLLMFISHRYRIHSKRD